MTLRTSLAILACMGSAACGAETASAPPAPPPPGSSATAAASAPPAEAPAPAPKPSMADMQKATLASLLAAFNGHDAKKLGDAYAQDAVLAEPAPEGMKETKGREAIVSMHDGLFKHVPDVAIAPSRVFHIGDVLVVEWVGSGSDGAKKTSFQGAMALTFDQGGLIKADHTYMDSATIAMQLGHAPGKPRPLATPPSGAPQTVVASGSDDEKKTAETLRANWPASWPKKDLKAFETSITDDAVHSDLGFPADAVGKKANVAELQMFAKSVPDMQVELTSVWAAGNVAIAEFVFSGTQKGPIGALKATGKKFTVHGLDVDEFKDGKLAKATTYDNAVEFLTQLGFMPPEGAAGAPKPAAAPKAAAPAPKADKAPKTK